jgi:hypothetical protein
MVYELDYKKPILYVVSIQNILGKLPLVPVGDTCTIPHSMRNAFSGAPGDRRPGAGDGCRMWFVNSGHWDGPVTCNKTHGIAARNAAGRKVPCEQDASPCLRRATVCSGCALTILIGFLSSAWAR